MNITAYQNFAMYRQINQPKQINPIKLEKCPQQKATIKEDTISFCGAHQGSILEKDK